MDQMLTNFIRALRNADVRISTAETLDAFSTLQLIGYADRQLLKQSLSLVLPKTQDEKALFDATFDQFFALKDPAALQPVASTFEPELGRREAAAPTSPHTMLRSLSATRRHPQRPQWRARTRSRHWARC
jgi:uncharacterized protein with von Willebrand factor type A (vWA) domain